jgi:hypothetical protein
VARKIERKELKKPDEFVDFGSRVLNWIADHRGALGISLAAVLVLVFGVMLVVHLRRSANVEDWRGLMGAVPVRAMSKDDNASPMDLIGKQEPAIWVDDQKMLGVADAADSDAARRLADLAVAGSALAKGDAAAAEQRYRAYLAGNPSPTSPGRLIAQEGLGYALERAGKLDEAKQAFAALGDLSDGAYKALALYHQGRLAAQQGRDEDARKLLLEAKAITDPRPADIAPQIESWLRALELKTLPPPPPPFVAPPPEPVPPPVVAPPPVESADGGASATPDAVAAPEEPASAVDAGAPQGDAATVTP